MPVRWDVVWGACFWASIAACAAEGPRVTHVATVAPDVLGITIETGQVIKGRQVPYTKQPGDAIDESQARAPLYVRRGGRTLGALVGARRELIWLFEEVHGGGLDTAWASKPESYRIESADDEQYRRPATPLAVHRKSKPTDMAQVDVWRFEFPMRHVIYLKLRAPLRFGAQYTIRFPGGGLPDYDYRHNPAKNRSEAVHVNQLGFRPDDPAKRGYLSCWLGDGGKLDYPENLRFAVLEDTSGKKVFEGKAILGHAYSAREDAAGKNHNRVNIYYLDFGSLAKRGQYRVCVEGVGSSYSFAIAPDAYREPLRVSLRGFYHQRNGIALKPPYATFDRPRAFHPDDGVKVFHSDCPLLDSGNGLNAKKTDRDNFGNLVRGKTDRIVANAWGGYFDAGDWDRRIQHLAGARLQLELVELFPAYFEKLELNIPESGNALPDAVDEALWGLDVYRRMQTPDGGIRGGIESEEHPRVGECSWQESLTVLAYAPDLWSSYVYAGVAARAAVVLASRNPELAREYRQSALRAMQWAELQWAKSKDTLPHDVRDARNLAALELFRLTGEGAWHEVFLATSAFRDPSQGVFVWQSHDQREAAFLCARLEQPGLDAKVQANARTALVREAEALAQRVRSTGFNWANINEYGPVGVGTLTTPQLIPVRAHYLTRDAKHLETAVLAVQSGMGGNPVNLCYTTGLGHDWPRNPLIVDCRRVGLPVYPGITVYGPINPEQGKGDFAQKLIEPAVYPAVATWPTTEAFFDVFLHPIVCEYTMMETLAPTGYVWGYLAAHP